MMMKMNRDHVHASTSGLSYQFRKGELTHVAPKVVQEVLAIGGEIVEADPAVEKAALAAIHAAEAEAADRAPTIEAAIRKMLARDQRGDFTAGGRPNLNVLYKETGFPIDAAELEPIWVKVKAALE